MLPKTFDPLSPTYRSQFVARVPKTHRPRLRAAISEWVFRATDPLLF
jgi:hypothetical protein